MTALFHDFYNKKADWIHELHSIKQPFILIIIDKLPILIYGIQIQIYSCHFYCSQIDIKDTNL